MRKLVGDGDLRTVLVGPGESMTIDLVQPQESGFRSLEFVVTPENQLSVTRYIWGSRSITDYPKIVTEASETLPLTAVQATKIRKRLSVYRPTQLDEGGPSVLPKGCNYIFDGSSRAVVAFQDKRGRSGMFVLQNGCDNGNAKKLAGGLREVVAAFPKTKTASNFAW